MNPDIRWRILITLGAIGLAAFALWPTYRYYSLSPEQIEDMDPATVRSMQGQALRLGLDLQGGMHIVLEIDDSDVEDIDATDLMDRALEVIRNRIDEFGVTEPLVQKAGAKRIIVELAGIDDIDRAMDIIGRAAILEFQMVRSGGEMRRLMEKLDLELAKAAGAPAPDTTASSDTTGLATPSLDFAPPAPPEEDAPLESAVAAGLDEEGEPIDLAQYLAEDVPASGNRPLASRIRYVSIQGKVAVNEEAAVPESDVGIIEAYLAKLDSLEAIPPDVEFAWHSDPFTDGAGNRMRNLYLLTSEPELTGEVLEDARAQPDNTSNIAGNFLVEFDLNRQGRRLFSRTTGENVGRLMAIVLDGKVKSAPEIQDKIRGGTASITGRFSAQEAADLAVVLRAGALPVPINVEELRAVGPSLGQDSIDLGTRAIVIGFVGVLIFMILYYRAGGAVAVFALLLNLGFLSAILVFLDAVLTLPGIAGFVLTVGMAVDANVLIFERIREELRLEQTFRNAIKRGYDKAYTTILDANLTTLIATIALYWFGTGPIKGFAVVLLFGIAVSMFTALFVTRLVFDLMTRGGGARNIPI